VKLALENGMAGFPSQHGAFAHVAGLKYVYDATKPVGERIVSVTLANGKNLDMNAMYKVATNDFIALGGDNYASFKGKKVIGEYEGLDEILASYIKSGAKAKATTEGRITPIK